MSMFNLSRANTKRIRGLHAALVEVRKVGHYRGVSRPAIEAVSNMTPSQGRKYLKACRNPTKDIKLHVQMLGRAERPQIVPPKPSVVAVELSKKFLAAVKAPDYDGYVRRHELAVWIRAAQNQMGGASDSKREYLNAGIAKLKAAFKD